MRLLKIILAALALSVSSTALAADDAALFSNPTAGIALAKPAGWHYVSAAQNLEHIKSMKLTDEEMQAKLRQYTTSPLLR